jgi:AcrR family transcriptional regulator
MINYYFGGKDGLFLAVIDSMFDDIVHRLRRLSTTAATDPTASVGELADVMMAIYTGWNPVLSLFSAGAAQPSGSVRVAYQRRLACRVYEALRQYLDLLVARGHCRPGLDVEVSAVLLGGLLGSPFHFSPLMNIAGHLTWESGHRVRWRDYFEKTVRAVLQ